MNPSVSPQRSNSAARRRVARLLQAPAVEISILVLILASVLLITAELGLEHGSPLLVVVERAGDALTALFVVELVLRYWVAPRKARFFQRYWVDILAVVPLVRPFRLFRVVRVLRLYRAGVFLNRHLARQGSALRTSASQLTALAALTYTIVICSAALLEIVEGGGREGLEGFHGALWFSVLSLVGGEPLGGEPKTAGGWAIALFLMLSGLTVFGVFVATVSASMVARIRDSMEVFDMDLDELVDHVVVLGWNRSAPTLLGELLNPGGAHGATVVLVTEDPAPEEIPAAVLGNPRFYHHRGDYTRVEVLEMCNLRVASKAIVLTDSQRPRSDQDKDARTVLTALTVEKMSPEIYTVAEVISRQAESLLRTHEVEEIVVGDWYAGVILGSASRNRGLVAVLDEILTTTSGNAFYTIEVPPRLEGKRIGELHQLLLLDHHATLISVRAADERSADVNPAPDRRVVAGEQLVVLAKEEVRL